MKLALKAFVLTAALCCLVKGQGPVSPKDLLAPPASDIAQAKKLGVEVFRLLPREIGYRMPNLAGVRGGGAYYSFVKRSHSYDETPQLQLQKDHLSVGFYGANLGLIADLGEIPLSDIGSESRGLDYLLEYRPPKYISAARAEHQKIGAGFERGGTVFKKHLPAVVGHTYLLRAVSYEEADTLVAFQISRKEPDGSLSIFWKPVREFENPVLLFQTDAELSAKLEKIRQTDSFENVKFEVKDNFVILRGTLPKEKINDLLRLVNAERTRGVQIALNFQ